MFKHLAAVLIFSAAMLIAGCSTGAPEPGQAAPEAPSPTSTRTTPPRPDRPAKAPRPQRIHISVSGPQDTLMRVARAGTQSQVALQGQPFDFEFIEETERVGDLGIAVFAKTETFVGEPLLCRITVNGTTVAKAATSKPGEKGYAEVECVVPSGA